MAILTNTAKEHIITTVAMAVALFSGFYLTDHYMAMQLLRGKQFWSPSLRWDHIIPFSPGWIWIYLLYFPMYFMPVTWREVWENKAVFRKAALGFALMTVASYFSFWIFSSQMQRPAFQPDDINGQVLFWFYELDPGFNIFPSLHVANIAYIACLAWGLKKRIISVGIWILCGFIAASTLFVKQHYILDLPSGLFVGIIGYILAFQLDVKIPQNSKSPLE